jgi:hypothetical protein
MELRRWRILGWVAVAGFLGVGFWWLYHVPTAGKGGLVLAVGATLMPLFWDKVAVLGKMAWVAMLFVLLAVEYRAIDKEHQESAEAQQENLREIGNGFEGVLSSEQTNFSSLIKTSQENFSKLIEGEQRHFESILTGSLTAQRQERQDFTALLAKEQELFTRQEELYEYSRGQLLPADDPIPTTCDPLTPDEFLVQMGNSAYVTNTFPYSILVVGGKQIITIDKSTNGTLLLSLDLRLEDGRIIAKIDRDGSTIVNPFTGAIVSRDKHTLIVEDQYGKDLVNARYLNKKAFRISGVIPRRGGDIKLPLPFLGGCIRSRNARPGGGIAVIIN